MIQMLITMRSVALDMDTKVNVLVPEDRHRTIDTRGTVWPVLYLLHGGKEDASSWLSLSTIMLNCRDLGLVVVMPSANNSSYVDEKYGQDYRTWIAEELPVKIRNILPVSTRREDTFIMGESMGGYGTLRLALSRPQQYGKAVCLSGGGNGGWRFEKPDKITAGMLGTYEEWENSDNNIDNLVRRLAAYKGEKPDLAFYSGTEDAGYERTKTFAENMKKTVPDMRIETEYWPGQHNFFFWNQAIPKALNFFGFEIRENSVV